MGSIVRPLEVFSKAAQERITNDLGAIEMETRARAARLKCPTAITGNICGLSDFTRNFYKETQCALLQETDDSRTDLSACLDLLRSANAPSPTIVLGGLSGRADRALGTLHSLVTVQSDSACSTPPPYVIILDGENLVCVLRKGSHRFEFDRSHLSGTCGIAPICQTETLVTTNGYRWNLNRKPLAFGGIVSTSNELTWDEVTVNTSAPLILTFELLSGSTNMTEPPH